MLIQVDNQPDPTKNPNAFKKWQDTLQELKAKFEAQGLSWVQYFGESPKGVNKAQSGIEYNCRDNNLAKDALLHKISKIK